MVRSYHDLGHGEGGDPGAVSGNFIERDMNIITGRACAERLAAAGRVLRTSTRTLRRARTRAMAGAPSLNSYLDPKGRLKVNLDDKLDIIIEILQEPSG